MIKYLEERPAAESIGVSPATLRKLMRSIENPPPHVRVGPRKVLFDADALLCWQQATWRPSK